MLQALRALGPVDPVYLGSAGGVEERLARRADVRFEEVSAAGVHGLTAWRVVLNLAKLARGVVAAVRAGRRERPEALFVTGGYASVPVALAAWLLRVPVLLYLPDIDPGLAVRFIARLASRIGVTTEDSRAHFPRRKVFISGYPVRAEFAGSTRSSARAMLGLEPGRPVVLFMGGSHGARSINEAVAGSLEGLLQEAQVVHVSGELDWPWVEARAGELPPDLRAFYHPLPYLHEIGPALAAADLVVCRAGASTLGELPYLGLPAVLVPYPHAWRYQRVNAQWLTDRGAAVQLEDARLQQDLLPMVRELLADPDRLTAMRDRARALARPDAAARLAGELRALGHRAPEEGSQ